MTTKTAVVTELVAAWDAWEAHPRAASPLFRREDALRQVARTLAASDDSAPVARVAAEIRDRMSAQRSRRVPTSDAVAQVLADMGGPGP